MSKEEFIKEFSKRLRNAILATDLTMVEIAKEADVAPSTLYGYAKGKATPNMRSVINLANVLNTSIDKLIFVNEIIE